jgi:hypothetical protein
VCLAVVVPGLRWRGGPRVASPPPPLAWREIEEIVRTRELHRFSRAPRFTARYQRHKARVVRQGWASLADYVVHEVFETPVVVVGARRRLPPRRPRRVKTCAPPAVPPGAAPPLVWRPNRFPYHVARGVEHHCVWSTATAALHDTARVKVCPPPVRGGRGGSARGGGEGE